MADYFTQFSCILDVRTAENAKHALTLRDQLAADLEDDEQVALGFELDIEPERGPGALWIWSDEYGEPEHVIAFVLECAEAFDLQGRWGFIWSLTCSKPRLDGFGGGAQLIDLGARRSLAWLDCAHWLDLALDPEADTQTGIARSALAGGEPAMGIGVAIHDSASAASEAPPVAAD